ncbi:MAG: glycosyltransferase family 4 protein [Verrucomicrobiota bacterium]
MVFSTDRVLFSDIVAGAFRKEESWEATDRRYRVMSRVMKRWGTRGADVIYAMQSENAEFLHFAKSKNIKIVVDICVNPLAHRITQKERIGFPGWEPPISSTELEALEAGLRENLLLADMVLCPSRVVADGVRDFVDIPRSRLSIVPYGSSFEIGENNARPGRILYAGEANMRKGIHYLASAAQLLCSNSPERYEFRIAGAASPQIRQREECNSLNFRGKLSKNELMNEYSSADVFVLPTLAEGLPAVLLEAMSFGVPIITTEASGLELDNGNNGIVVPERDADALANAIERVVADRELRARLAEGAQKLAHEYTTDVAGKRFVQALSGASFLGGGARV